jgi:hypothetical protein
VIEVWFPPGTPAAIPAGWSEVTLEQLHYDSIRSPSENMAAAIQSTAIQDGIADPVGETDEGDFRSYIVVQRIHNRSQVTLGSETWRSWTTPGICWTYGESRMQEVLYFSASTRDQWGYKAYVQAPPKFIVQSYLFRQNGFHALNTLHYPKHTSTVEGYYP